MSIAEGRAGLRPAAGFPRPLEVAVPRECEGWEEMYPQHDLFAEDRREFEESRFWFQDSVHYAEPYYPFDAVLADCIAVNFSQTSARRFAVPTSLGVEQRILGGYVYLSPSSISDEAVIDARAELFAVRGGYYYEHWDELDRQWREKVQIEIRALEALEVPALSEVEEQALVTSGGAASSHLLLAAYDRLLEGFDRVSQYHFELMNLGYGAYLALYELCHETFPDISEMTIAKMVAGIDVVALRPDDELKRLAIHAVELGVGAQVRSAHDETALTTVLADTAAGEQWLTAYGNAKDPWFYLSYGNGLYHHHRSWIDDPTLPIAMIGSYTARVEAGEDIRRHRDAIVAQRDQVTEEYRALLTEQERHAFDRQLALARTVFPHIEDHNFYIDHWSHTVLWNKVREFGALLSDHRFLADPEDVFFLHHGEVARRARGAAAALELRRRRRSPGPGPLAGHRRTAQDDLRRAASLGSAPRPRTRAGSRDRTGDDHALGDHDRARPRVASVSRDP